MMEDDGHSSGSRPYANSKHTYRRSTDFHFPPTRAERKPFLDLDEAPNAQPPWARLSRSGTFTKKRLIWAVVILVVTIALGKGLSGSRAYWPAPVSSYVGAEPYSGLSGVRGHVTFENGTQWQRPAATKIIGIVFFGRRQFVDILDCYLRRNLAVNGGILDEVHFLMHTEEEADKVWLRRMVKESKMGKWYKLKAEDTHGEGWNLWGTFEDLYEAFLTDKNAIYIKMDDDLMFIDDYTIPELVRVTLENPGAYNVQANIVNNKWNYWYHHRTGAIWPYLAEQDKASKWPADAWRPSQLPMYSDPLPSKQHLNFSGGQYPVPSEGHRWLPLEPTYQNTALTPYGPFLPNPMFHTGAYSVGWAVTAQSHFSLFENLERRQLEKYSWGNTHGTWNLWYTRYNINMMAIRGEYVLKRPFWNGEYEGQGGDEPIMTINIPKDLDMPVLVATRAVASHFSFRGDRESLLRTDVLDRYRAIANEFICTPDNKKKRFGRGIGPHHTEAPATPVDDGADGSDDTIGDGPQDIINPEIETETDARR